MEHLVEKTATGERFICGIMPAQGQVKVYKHKEVHMRMCAHIHLARDILLCTHAGPQNRLLVRVGQNLRTVTYTDTRLPDCPGCSSIGCRLGTG